MSYVRQPEIVKTENTSIPVERLFIDGVDKNVAAVVIYTTNGTKFTYDKEGNVEVAADDMFDLFIKGVVAVKNNVFYKPTSCTKAGVITFPFSA